MTKQEIHKKAFEAALLAGFNTYQAGTMADVKAKEWESEQHFAAAGRAQREAAAYHALSVRDNAIDRKWAALLSAA